MNAVARACQRGDGLMEAIRAHTGYADLLKKIDSTGVSDAAKLVCGPCHGRTDGTMTPHLDGYAQASASHEQRLQGHTYNKTLLRPEECLESLIQLSFSYSPHIYVKAAG